MKRALWNNLMESPSQAPDTRLDAALKLIDELGECLGESQQYVNECLQEWSIIQKSWCKKQLKQSDILLAKIQQFKGSK